MRQAEGVVARGRAAGIITIASIQQPSADIVPTSLRDLFGYRLAFRCATNSSSDIILAPAEPPKVTPPSTSNPKLSASGLLEVLEERFVTSVLALEEAERAKLLSWPPVIRDTIIRAQHEAEMLATKLVGGERFSQISPTGPSNETGQVAEVPPDLLLLLVELRGFEPLTSSMPWKRATNCAKAPRCLATREV